MKQRDLFSGEPSPVSLKTNEEAKTPKSTQSFLVSQKRTSENELWESIKPWGFYVIFTRLRLWKEKVLAVKRIKARHIGKYTGQRVSLIGWPVTQKEVWTKDGLTMSFLTFEDETTLYETVIFPKVYDRYNNRLVRQLRKW